MPGSEPTEPASGGDLATAAPPGGHLGRYVVKRLIGSGGMGVVLAAHDPELDRPVAIKLLHRDGGQAQERLVQEARAMARLHHPNVVMVHDVGVCDGRVFVAMDLVEGETLRRWMEARPRGWREIVALFVAAGRGLAAAHAVGLLHGDFKPDNVLVDARGTPHVADFGLARSELDGAAPIGGTPAYMAPELRADNAHGAAVDQFAFAVSLWEAVCGELPFGSADGQGERKRTGVLTAPAPDVPRWLVATLRRALAPLPEHRFPSIAMLVDHLERGLGRRRRWAIAGASATALVATALIASRFVQPEGPNCELAGRATERVWNTGTRVQVAASFLATTRPHAAATLTRVVDAIDRRTTQLATARISACEATHVRGEQSASTLDRRMECLDRRLDGVRALVALFAAGADNELLDRAYDATNALPGPEDCEAGPVAGEPVAPAATRVQIAAARRVFADAKAKFDAGKHVDAARILTSLRALASSLAYPPLTAEVLLLHARVTAAQGKAAAARAAFEEAALAAAAARNDSRIADAWLDEIALLADAGGDVEGAAARLPAAEVAVARAGRPEQREEYLVVRSDIESVKASYAVAIADLEEARASIARRGQAKSYAATRMAMRLASVLSLVGRNDEALALDQSSLASWSALFGPDHPKVAQIQNNVAIRLDARGRYAEARQLLARSLSIKERTFGPAHPSLAFTLNNIGMVAGHQGQLADERAAFERALAIRETALGPNHPLVASSLGNLAEVRRVEAKLPAALALGQRSVAIYERAYGPDHPDVAASLLALGRIQLDLGQLADAETTAQRSLAIRQRVFGADHEKTVDSMELVADIFAAQHREREACALRAREVAAIEKSSGKDHPTLAVPLAEHARCLYDAGDATAGRVAAERAVAIGAHQEIDPTDLAIAQFSLARALWSSVADRARAIELARAALAAYSAGPTAATPDMHEVEHWLATHRTT